MAAWVAPAIMAGSSILGGLLSQQGSQKVDPIETKPWEYMRPYYKELMFNLFGHHPLAGFGADEPSYQRDPNYQPLSMQAKPDLSQAPGQLPYMPQARGYTPFTQQQMPRWDDQKRLDLQKILQRYGGQNG